jgi:hypothetical protein
MDVYKITQKRKLSLAATGPSVFKIEGEFSPHAAKRIEDKSRKLTRVSQRFVPRNTGFLTSESPRFLIEYSFQSDEKSSHVKL